LWATPDKFIFLSSDSHRIWPTRLSSVHRQADLRGCLRRDDKEDPTGMGSSQVVNERVPAAPQIRQERLRVGAIHKTLVANEGNEHFRLGPIDSEAPDLLDPVQPGAPAWQRRII
jgi:hypothetical protein